MPRKRGELGFACMECGRTFGSIIKKSRIWSAASTADISTKYRIKEDYRGNEHKIPVEPKVHPYKYLSGFVQLFNPSTTRIAPEKHPIINPPLATPVQHAEFQNSEIGIALEGSVKDIMILRQMILIINERYPILFERIEKDFAAGVSFLRKILAYDKDYRYKRNFFEWLEICQTAKEKSTSAASREYYGTTPNGQRVRLSPSYIKKKCVEIERLANDGLTYWPILTECMDLIGNLIRSDPVLSRRCREVEDEYNGGAILRNRDQEMKEHDLSERAYSYYIRHYDAGLYREQEEDYNKGKRKSKPDGMIECGPFRLSDFPARFKNQRKS